MPPRRVVRRNDDSQPIRNKFPVFQGSSRCHLLKKHAIGHYLSTPWRCQATESPPLQCPSQTRCFAPDHPRRCSPETPSLLNACRTPCAREAGKGVLKVPSVVRVSNPYERASRLCPTYRAGLVARKRANPLMRGPRDGRRQHFRFFGDSSQSQSGLPEKPAAYRKSQLAPLECTAKQLRHCRMARMSPWRCCWRIFAKASE